MPAISIIHEYLDWVNDCYQHWPQNNRLLFFRGHANSDWKLLPSVFRMSDPGLERRVILDYKQTEVPDMDYHTKMENMLVIMQHHCIPTRQLDWSMNPLVALYFSCLSGFRKQTGQVFCLNPWEAYGIIVARLHSKHPQLMDILKEGRMKLAQGWSFQDIYNFIKCKYNFDLECEALRAPVPFVGRYMTDRIEAQRGGFVMWGDGDCHSFAPGLHRDLREYPEYAHTLLSPFTIPHRQKKNVLAFLRKLDINNFAVFPDLYGFKEDVKSVGGIFNI